MKIQVQLLKLSVMTKACLVVTLVGLTLITARTGSGQDVSVKSAANRSMPRVTTVKGEIKIGEEVTFQIDHLSDWAVDHDPQTLVPYLNGRALKGLYPEQINLSENKLLFHLRRTPDSKQVWADLFHEPVLRRPVSVSVGLENQLPFDTIFDDDNRLGPIVIPKAFGLASLAVISLAVILFSFLVRRTDIIRYAGPRPESGKEKRYSLERAQTAFWFLLVSVAYICLWLITGDFNTLTPSVLVLIGISGATALGARLLVAGHKRGSIGTTDQLSTALSECASGERTSAGFFTDILSNGNGYGFHRFQMVAWTILLGVIFAYSIYHNLAMPEFSGGLLIMTGISAATYLGFESLDYSSRRTATPHQPQGALK